MLNRGYVEYIKIMSKMVAYIHFGFEFYRQQM